MEEVLRPFHNAQNIRNRVYVDFISSSKKKPILVYFFDSESREFIERTSVSVTPHLGVDLRPSV